MRKRDGLREIYCYTCKAANAAAWRAKHPDRQARSLAIGRYNLDYQEYDDLMQIKNCQICGSTEKLHIDHDHETGQVRGRLCDTCNRGLGYFKEDPYLLEQAIKYLGKDDT